MVKRMVFWKSQQNPSNIYENEILKMAVSQNLELAAAVDRDFRVSFVILRFEFDSQKPNDIDVEPIDYLEQFRIKQESDFELIQIYFNDFKWELVLVFNNRKHLVVDILEYSPKDN